MSEKKKLFVADLFCGAGGETTGMINAFKNLGQNYEMLAINHWDVAIETHSKNHPEVKHYCETIQNVDPLEAVPGGRLHFLWASPECTHHSNARGGRPRSDQSRASAWLVLKWLQELYVDRVYIENVPEFVNWGPIGVNGKPLKSKKGKLFESFLNDLKNLGYKVDYMILNAADFGAPTTRKRLIIQAVRGKNKIKWAEPTHSNQPSLFGAKKWVAAKEIIDWNFKGKSIAERKKPLAENTLKRIETGMRKYWGEWAEPFVKVLRGQTNLAKINNSQIEPFIIATGQTSSRDRSSSINQPISTVVTKQEHCLIEPLILHQMSGVNCVQIDNPVPTITTKCGHGLIEPFLIKYYGNETGGENINDPLDTITTKERFALVEGDFVQLDIRFRMLQPHELAAAQSFPKEYQFAGGKVAAVKQIGNAVPPKLAEALIKAALAV